MEKLIDLLKRWAELEPNRCRDVGGDSAEFKVQRYDTLTWVGPTSYGNILEDTVQGAVQQAIEARGFKAVIRIGAVLSMYRAEISIRVGKGDGMISAESNNSPAEALLAAYLQAIEATAEVSG